jgi:hypothetical protein
LSPLVTLVIEGERIYTTPEHPFYVNGQWIDASNLSVGDLVRRLDGSAGDVEAITMEERPQVMYNLTGRGVYLLCDCLTYYRHTGYSSTKVSIS